MATRTRKTTTARTVRKTKAKAAASSPPVAVVAEAAPEPVPETLPETLAVTVAAETVHVELKMKELVDRVVTATEGKRPQVRAVTEAVLSQLGAALGEGQTLNLPGLGKVRVLRTVDRMLTLRLRRPPPAGAETAQPLAKAGEGG